uniref:RNA helicase n=1 Tax=Ananas comosus var. bracteatus TaxID=296719 RepID=A0A6V7QRI0_ANACO
MGAEAKLDSIERREEGDVDVEKEGEEEKSFEELGLDEQLTRALRKKSVTDPTPIQRAAIPLILSGKNVVARAKTGSGKTFAYLLPMLHELLRLSSENSLRKSAPNVFILVPTRDLCHQVYSEASSLLEFCTNKFKIVHLMATMPIQDMRVALSGPPNIVVATPACISTCTSKGVLRASSIRESISMLILDEADLLLSHGHEADLKALIPHIPRSCQCILMSATTSPDVDKLKKLLLHEPVTLTLSEEGQSNSDLIPGNIEQYWISCSAHDKLLYIYALLKPKPRLLAGKVLIFVNSIDMAFRLRLFLEKFEIRSAVLNAELPQNSRLHILEEFNAGLFGILIATDDNQTKEKDQTSRESQVQSRSTKKKFRQNLDAEFGVVRGIDFKNVFTVINFDMPRSPAGYVHRIGRTGRGCNTGTAVSLVSPEEGELFAKIKIMLEGDSRDDSVHIQPFPHLTKKAVEDLRYRAEDAARSVTTRDVQDARHQDLKKEILNSEKLKAHFEENPRDLDLLKHDKILSKTAPPSHLRVIPDYLIDPTTKQVGKALKLSRAAMGINTAKKRPGFKKGFGRSSDPLKTFSAEKKKRRDNDGKDHRQKKKLKVGE